MPRVALGIPRGAAGLKGADMAKGQKKSNRETRKPKQPAAKPPEQVSSVLNPARKKT